MSGFEPPNYTQTPNAFFDKLLAKIDSITELKVTLAVIRKTFGYHKEDTGDMISLSQLQEMTGLPRKSVVDGISRALKRGSIVREPSGNSYLYRVKVVTTGNQHDIGGGNERLPEVVTTGYPQKKEKESYSRRDANASPEQQKNNWFTLYCQRASDVGLAVSDDDRKRWPGNLARCQLKEGASDTEMHRVIGRMIQRRLEGFTLSPQDALNDIWGTSKKKSYSKPSPDCVITALESYENDGSTDLRRFAVLARQYDFTTGEDPPWQIASQISPSAEERQRYLTRIRSVARRAVREAS